ncbi:MAG: hypothetical protein ABJF01_25625 [bacterium]
MCACVPGRAPDLFQEAFGYDQAVGDGHQAAPGLATAFITVRDDAGNTALVVATGQIVPGALPTTYTETDIAISCR